MRRKSAPPRHARSSESGQITVLTGMMMLTFLVFLAFVVNTGMLVHAKINLQNAADLAAYAGAATQARQLNSIAVLNYEMRRQLKKYLFRYYVIGNMSQGTFPRGQDPRDQRPDWKPSASGLSYNAPVVCIIFDPTNNYCQLSKQQKIDIPPSVGMDAAMESLRAQLQRIEDLRQASCTTIGAMNETVSMSWLYKATVGLPPALAGVAGGNAAQNRSDIVKHLTHGLGLVPRELLLRLRIDTLAEYVDLDAAQGLTFSRVSDLMARRDPMKYERQIQAFLSAYYTLGYHTFADSNSIQLDELLPAKLLKLEELRERFDAYAVQFEKAAGSGGAPADCAAVLKPITARSQGVHLGVYKDPQTLTYYALRLKAKARLLFSPWGDLELKAYAAAMPFGSRIGPTRDDVKFKMQVQPYNVAGGGADGTNDVPNIPIRENDSSAQGKGWDNILVLSAMFQHFFPPGQSGNSLPLNMGPADFEKIYQRAMAPNPWESGRYQIPADREDPFQFEFDEEGIMAFWAPIFSPENSSSEAVQQKIEQELNDVLPEGPPNSVTQQLREQTRQGIQQYLRDMKQGQGEDGESLLVATMRDPLTLPPDPASPDGQRTRINLNGGADAQLTLTEIEKIRTAWSDLKTQKTSDRDRGRTGYSVKLVSFQSLASGAIGGQSFTNRIPSDSEWEPDAGKIQH
jgi:hypothetical protein